MAADSIGAPKPPAPAAAQTPSAPVAPPAAPPAALAAPKKVSPEEARVLMRDGVAQAKEREISKLQERMRAQGHPEQRIKDAVTFASKPSTRPDYIASMHPPPKPAAPKPPPVAAAPPAAPAPKPAAAQPPPLPAEARRQGPLAGTGTPPDAPAAPPQPPVAAAPPAAPAPKPAAAQPPPLPADVAKPQAPPAATPRPPENIADELRARGVNFSPTTGRPVETLSPTEQQQLLAATKKKGAASPKPPASDPPQPLAPGGKPAPEWRKGVEASSSQDPVKGEVDGGKGSTQDEDRAKLEKQARKQDAHDLKANLAAQKEAKAAEAAAKAPPGTELAAKLRAQGAQKQTLILPQQPPLAARETVILPAQRPPVQAAAHTPRPSSTPRSSRPSSPSGRRAAVGALVFGVLAAGARSAWAAPSGQRETAATDAALAGVQQLSKKAVDPNYIGSQGANRAGFGTVTNVARNLERAPRIFGSNGASYVDRAVMSAGFVSEGLLGSLPVVGPELRSATAWLTNKGLTQRGKEVWTASTRTDEIVEVMHEGDGSSDRAFLARTNENQWNSFMGLHPEIAKSLRDQGKGFNSLGEQKFLTPDGFKAFLRQVASQWEVTDSTL